MISPLQAAISKLATHVSKTSDAVQPPSSAPPPGLSFPDIGTLSGGDLKRHCMGTLWKLHDGGSEKFAFSPVSHATHSDKICVKARCVDKRALSVGACPVALRKGWPRRSWACPAALPGGTQC